MEKNNVDFSENGTRIFSSFLKCQKHLLENKERLHESTSFQMYFDESNQEQFLDEMDGIDELYKQKQWLVKNHKSIVFQVDVTLPYIMKSFEDVIPLMTPVTDDNGIYKKVLKSGDGNLTSSNTVVAIHYNAFLEHSDEPFDASVFGTMPYKKFFTYKLDSFMVFPGLELAIQSMEYGEVAVFIFYPKYFYGPLGCPPRIPKNASSLFFIELLNIKDDQRKKVYEQTEEEIQQLPFSEVFKTAIELKEAGNKKFNAGQWNEAINRYQMGVNTLKCHYNTKPEDLESKHTLTLTLISNHAQCYLEMKKYKKLIKICEYAMELHESTKIPATDKLYYRYAKGLMKGCKLASALKMVQKGRKLYWNNSALQNLEEQINGAIELENRLQRNHENKMAKTVSGDKAFWKITN